MRPIRHLLSLLPPTLIALGLAACSSKETPAPAADAGAAPADTSPVVVYCGRSKAMVQGIFDAFTKESGIKVEVRYGDTTALANTVLEEGDASPADLFFAQDAGALGALRAGGRLAALPDALTSQVDARFRAPDNTWIGTSGRARVVAYNTDKLKPEDLPTTIDGFTDPKWKGAASDLFLKHAADLVAAKGGRLINVDVTLICERPKIKPHRQAMRERLAQILDLPLDRVSVKATTTEGMGFTGRGEGLAAQALATVETPV